MNPQNKKTAKVILLILVVSGILFSPLVLYISQFGTKLSTDHAHWAEFGSIMSGVYSPLIALVALYILVIQSLIQRSMNKHQHDQAFISAAREDINFYIGKLENYLSRSYDGSKSIQEHITSHYRALENNDLNNLEVVQSINAFHEKHQYIVDIWMAIYPILKGLQVNKKYPYEHALNGGILRVSSCLSFATCRAIDNMYHVITKDIQHGQYYYK